MKYLLFALILLSCGSRAPKPSQRTHGDTLFLNDGSIDAGNKWVCDTVMVYPNTDTLNSNKVDTFPRYQEFMVDTSGNAAYIVGRPSPKPLKIKMKPRWRESHPDSEIIYMVQDVYSLNDSVFYIKSDPADSGYLSKEDYDTFLYKVDSLATKDADSVTQFTRPDSVWEYFGHKFYLDSLDNGLYYYRDWKIKPKWKHKPLTRE